MILVIKIVLFVMIINNTGNRSSVGGGKNWANAYENVFGTGIKPKNNEVH